AFAVADRRLDDRGELDIALVLEADIAWIDAVFVERLGAGRMIGEQFVADVVKIADQRHVHALPREPVADMRNRGGRLVAIDGDAYQFRPGARQGGDLPDRLPDIGRVGVGHRL